MHVHDFMHESVFLYFYVRERVCILINVSIYFCAVICIRSHVCLYVQYAHAYVNTYDHTYIHTYTHTYPGIGGVDWGLRIFFEEDAPVVCIANARWCSSDSSLNSIAAAVWSLRSDWSK